MEKLTDRSPRTPPALSNATPRLLHYRAEYLTPNGVLVFALASERDDAEQYLLENAEGMKSRIVTLVAAEPYYELRAAPPVAEGPAATPRQSQAVSPWGVSENLTVLPKPAAAATPPEARAAARFCCSVDDEGRWWGPDGRHIPLLLKHAMEGIAKSELRAIEYVADLQRQLDATESHWRNAQEAARAESKRHAETLGQLDEARRELEVLRKSRLALMHEVDEWKEARNQWRQRAESAEAANQELRAYVQSVVAYDHAKYCTATACCATCVNGRAALLGPQHG